MATHSLDIATFRIAFPQFASAAVYPDPRLDVTWGLATGYLGDADGVLLDGNPLQAALEFMTAHLLALSQMQAEGTMVPGPITGTTIDKVQVQFAPPPFKNGWGWWLSQTPYGAQLWALLQAKAGGGFYAGGNPERAAFRRVGGGFGQGWW